MSATRQRPQEKPRDIDPATFRAAMHRTADIVADYLESAGRYPVLPRIAPGDVRKNLGPPPTSAEPIHALLDDYLRLIEPNVTHWNHPGFMAYFAISGSRPGVIAETLAAALNVNAMLWRTGPAPTELEEHVCDWLREWMGLPPGFRGHINDTASISSTLALAAARQSLSDLDIRQRGMAGRADLPPLTVYCSAHAHSSIDKACLMLGIGLNPLRKIAVDGEFRMIPAELDAAIRRDVVAGCRPMAIVATVGTTSTSSVDPLPAIVEIARGHKVWLHVDAAYAGSAAICPEYRALMAGIEHADSLVTNPHKWLAVPVDCSILFLRDVSVLRAAFSLVAEYLKTSETDVTNLMDLGVQLGRRFRSLKMWMVFRALGLTGLQDMIRGHCELARELAGWIERDQRFELSAPVPFSLVCFRARVGGDVKRQNRFNERLLEGINAAGPFLLSHTKLGDTYVLRCAIGNIHTTYEHVERLWTLVCTTFERLSQEGVAA